MHCSEGNYVFLLLIFHCSMSMVCENDYVLDPGKVERVQVNIPAEFP